MSLTRQTQKVFGSNANANQLAVFGTMKTGTPVYSTNLATLQSTDYTKGWSEAILNDKAPYMEEMNAVQYGLSYQIAYMLQEGAFAYDANTTYSSTSIVKAFENGKMYFYHSLVDNNTGHALSDSVYWEKINISDTRNIGEVVTSLIPLTDAGLHLLDGSLLSGSGSYSAFVSYIAGLYTADPTANYFISESDWQTSVTTYGVCGKFVYDSVNNTVRLPKVTGFIEGTIDVSALGDLVEAGLPNITGTFRGINYGDASGAFTYQSSNFGYANFTAPNGDVTKWTFDASRSSSIYKNDFNKVQPQAIKGFMYIVVASTAKTNIQVDIDEIATDLNGKADVDLSNTNDTAKILMSGMGMPSSTKVDLTLGASGSTYTAPANGWVYFTIQSNASNAAAYITSLSVNDDEMLCFEDDGGAGNNLNMFIPVSKNQTFKVGYSDCKTFGSQTTDRFGFIYAVGSESEAQ